MSDLISRSATLQFVQKIKDKINDNKCFGDGTRKLNMGDLQDIILFIENAPTAYDTEAVVAELERNANEKFELYTLSRGINFRASGMSDAFKEAIDIVRKGGV